MTANKSNGVTTDLMTRSWNRCDVCTNRDEVFESAALFARHLRDVHSTREGGSHVCRYGPNNICSSLPVEGVSDRDYESHIAKCHIFPNQSKNRQSSHKVLSRVNSGKHANDKQVIRDHNERRLQKSNASKRSPFPLPSSSDLFESISYSSEAKPNVISDSLQKWNVYSSSQNLAAVLNDPSKARSYYDTIFTKEWGNYFVDTQTVLQSPFHPKISHSHFDQYVRRVLKRNRRQRLRSRSESLSLQTQSQTRNVEAFVPKVFFDSEFNLEDIDTFKTVLSFCTNKEVLQSCPSSPTKWNSIAKDALKELQRNFSEYLDVVEENLAKQISLKSKNFFQVMSTMDTVMEQLKRTIKEVTNLRKKCRQLDDCLIEPSLKNIKLTKARNNLKEVYNKINLMATVHQTQPTIQLLLSTLDFVGALDLISTSQEVAAQELSGVYSFRHLKLQLVEIEKVIDQMMNEEFIKFLTHEWNRPFDDENESNHLLDDDKLLSIIYGMVRLQKFNFIDAFRDEANTAIKAVVKQTVIETLSSEDNIDVGQQIDGSLFDQLRLLDFSKWLQLFDKVFDNLLKCLRRINAVYRVMSNGLSAVTERSISENKALELATNGGETSIDTITILLENDGIELGSNLKESLCTICDYAHSRCANVVDSRAKDGGLDKLTANEFVRLIKSIEEFSDSCQQICGRKSPNLKLVLQTQANKFVTKFHEERKKRINSLLDIEQWKSVDFVSYEFQQLVNQLIDNNYNFYENNRSLYDNNQKLKSHVLVKDEKFVVVNVAIVFIKTLIEYCECAQQIKSLSPDLLTRLLDILKLFNSRTAQLVLGAGALQVAGLKTITARKLIISSRCLQLVIVFIPIIRRHFETLLSTKHQSMCNHFDEIIRLYNEHITKIPEKVVSVVREIADTQLSKWVAKAPVPSPPFQAISQHLMRLHDNIQDSLPTNELTQLFQQIHNTVKDVLKHHLERLNIQKNGGLKHGLVTQELTFYTQNLSKLSIGKQLNLSNDDLWSKLKIISNNVN
ncbi:vacuolar protein sorting-associated protein 54-like [Oppia nitens]|uniref:vacuolar protein sorting-associated protein 54-like n=1 Tax=Oppia nitens TaxID=1686743 RepID=UPI0023D9A827|nr:vacuolar protein sorting-associated protein 54-like [Oppia nitens]